MSTCIGTTMEKFRAVLDLQFKYRYALGYGLVTLTTAGCESIFSKVIFQCPCSVTWNLPYGLVFLLAPALILFIMGFLVRTGTWRLLTRCCELGCPMSCNACQQKVSFCWQLSCTAALAPFTWMAVALLGGSFYECASSGSLFLARHLCSKLYTNDTDEYGNCLDQLPLVPCQKAKLQEVQDLLQELKAHSQVGGWLLIALVIIVFLIGTTVAQCQSPVSFLQLNFWKIYLKQEQEIFKSQATEHATELAKENVNCFFKNTKPEKHYTPNRDAWQQISSLYTFNPKEQYYSMLHQYVNKREMSHSGKPPKDYTAVPALNFVDSYGLSTTDDL